jgi:diguanylate cyclase (GGDEF)-like protein
VAISPSENAFTSRDQEVLVLVAGVMAVVLENIANMEMLSRELEHMRLLHDVVSEIALLRDRKSIAEKVVDLLKKNFQYTHVTFFEIDGEDVATCRTIASTGYAEKDFAFFDAERKRRGGGLVELAARTKTLRNTPDVRLCKTYVPSIHETLSELDAPIMYGDRLLGVLTAESSQVGAFSREDEEVFYILSRSLGATWAVNALLEELERQAFTDALTGIPNRRFLFQKMATAQQALNERAVPFAVVMADVERFKDINDTFGHALGDEVLVSIARCFRENVGAFGIVGRYGGDEFLLLFPEMTKDAAEALVSRLDGACRTLRFSEPTLRVRANFGIAAFPEDGPTLESVLREADRRMYAAKGQA